MPRRRPNSHPRNTYGAYRDPMLTRPQMALAGLLCAVLPSCGVLARALEESHTRTLMALDGVRAEQAERIEALDSRVVALRAAYDEGTIDERTYLAERDAIVQERIASIGTALTDSIDALREGASEAGSIVEEAKDRATSAGYSIVEMLLAALTGSGTAGAALFGLRRLARTISDGVNRDRDLARIARGEPTGGPTGPS